MKKPHITKCLSILTAFFMAISFMQCHCFAFTYVPIVSNADVLFDSYIEELSSLNMELSALNDAKENDDIISSVYDKRYEQLTNQIEDVKANLSSIGAETPDTDLDNMVKLFLSTDNQDRSVSTLAYYEDAETYFANALSMLNQMYDIYGRQDSYYNGSKTYEYYSLRIVYSSAKAASNNSNVHLYQVNEKVFYDKITANSIAATNFVNEIIDIYIQKIVSGAFDAVGLGFLPYELFTSSKPSPSTISSTGSAMYMRLRSTNTLKYTFIYDSEDDCWIACTISNMVQHSFDCDLEMSRGSTPVSIQYKSPNRISYGGYTNDVPQAVNIYNNIKAGQLSSPADLCIKKLKCKSLYAGELVHNIAHPTYLSGLIA